MAQRALLLVFLHVLGVDAGGGEGVMLPAAYDDLHGAVPPEVKVLLDQGLERQELSQLHYNRITQTLVDLANVTDARADSDGRRRAQVSMTENALPAQKFGWANFLRSGEYNPLNTAPTGVAIVGDGPHAPMKTLPDGSSLFPMEGPPAGTTCDSLREQYFGDSVSSSDPDFECFLHGTNWPELLARKETTLDWENLMAPTDGSGTMLFVVGAGAGCVNVTFFSQEAGVNSTVVECLYDGQHETNNSQVAVGTDDFETVVDNQIVIGDCTDVLIRVTTTGVASGQTVEWEINDGGDNGPWTHENPGAVGLHEYFTCLYDHNFTLRRLSESSDGWTGTVEVTGYVDAHRYDRMTAAPSRLSDLDTGWCKTGTYQTTRSTSRKMGNGLSRAASRTAFLSNWMLA